MTAETLTDAQIVEFRAALSIARADIHDEATRLIDYCNRALGAPIYEGQGWVSGPAPAGTYIRCNEPRRIVARAIEGANETSHRGGLAV